MGEFQVRVKPEIIQQRVSAAQTRDINALAEQYKLDKNQIYGDGVDIQEAPDLPFDMFMKLSGNDTKITKADLLKFAGTETASDVVREYAEHIAGSLPAKVMEAGVADGKDVNASLQFQVVKRGEDIFIKADRSMLNNENAPRTEATAAGVFSVISGKDINGDGAISVGGELQGSAFVQSAGDAVRLAGPDMVVSPTEALSAIFEKAGRFNPGDVVIEYKTGK